MNQITLEQLIAWHGYFSTHPKPTKQIEEITTAIEKRLHDILTTLKSETRNVTNG